MPTTKTTAVKTRGRPAIQAGEDTVPITIRLTSSQQEKLQRLGGAPWIRARIDKAREPGEDK
jgi:hypothetical protein